MDSKLLPKLISLTFEAGETIMSLHKKPSNVIKKNDFDFINDDGE